MNKLMSFSNRLSGQGSSGMKHSSGPNSSPTKDVLDLSGKLRELQLSVEDQGSGSQPEDYYAPLPSSSHIINASSRHRSNGSFAAAMGDYQEGGSTGSRMSPPIKKNFLQSQVLGTV